MLFVTWNVNSLRARLVRVTSFLERNKPDILCMQETKMQNGQFESMRSEFTALGYSVFHHGNGPWNGVAIATLVKDVEIVQRGFQGQDPDFGVDRKECRFIAARVNSLISVSAYIPNGRELGSIHMENKLAWLDALKVNLEALREKYSNCHFLVEGDFNIAPLDSDVWDIAAFEGMTHVSEAEREKLSNLLNSGFVDLWQENGEVGKSGFTWWDYRSASYKRGHGMRIDLALYSPPLIHENHSFSTERIWVDRSEREGEKPSDHAPLCLDAQLN
ncbi:MAG: exodeoxyribonuclease III [Acidimicrobiales bacterium]|nr:exodeoxyribonuclease III [Acidimicrobiales bacterium]